MLESGQAFHYLFLVHSNAKMTRPHYKVYWAIWLTSVVIVLLLRFVVMVRVPADRFERLVLLYFAGTWIVAVAFTLIEYLRFKAYLKKHHHERWCEIANDRFGPFDNLRGRVDKLATSPDDFGDPNMAVLKMDYRKTQELAMIILLSFCFLVPVLLCEFELQF